MREMNRVKPRLALVFPCYNEEAALPFSFREIDAAMTGLIADNLASEDSFAIYVDDGSADATWNVIAARAGKGGSRTRGVKLMGNVGHQNALYAGMMEALRLDVDCVISLDVDLQDDISTAADMLRAFAAGDDIVYGVRGDRTSDTPFKRWSAGLYYRALSALKVNVVPQHADYRLCGRNVLEAISRYGETELFLRALIPSLGLRSSKVRYSRKPRMHGETKYPLRKMLSLAWRGVTSFSSAPLRLTALFSLIFLFLALAQGLLVLSHKFYGDAVPGYSSLMLVVLFFSSLNLFSLAIIGEYIAKMFIEVKHRPRYLVEKRI
jgi:glycosyltransferase involved in cell wall biosynthesis